MTPLGIEIMLHYYTRPDQFRDGDFSAPAVRDTLMEFAKDGLLGYLGNGQSGYVLAERGQAYIEFLCEMPLPVSEWSLPGNGSARARGQLGGRARAASLTPERRSEIAQDAARARWNKPNGTES